MRFSCNIHQHHHAASHASVILNTVRIHLTSHASWHGGNVNSLPLKVKPGNTWRGKHVYNDVRFKEKMLHFLITSHESYIFLSLINQILAVVKNFARMKIRGFFS